jgi:hypothetical protein
MDHLSDEVWVGEIRSVVICRVLAYSRECVDGDERVLWAGVAPVVWRPATQAECDSFVPHPVEHLLCGRGLPTIPGNLCIT